MKKQGVDWMRVLFWLIFAIFWINIGHLTVYFAEKSAYDYNYNHGKMGVTAKILYPSPTTFNVHKSYLVTKWLSVKPDPEINNFTTYHQKKRAAKFFAALLWPFVWLVGWLLALFEWVVWICEVVLWKFLIVNVLWNGIIKFAFGGKWTNLL